MYDFEILIWKLQKMIYKLAVFFLVKVKSNLIKYLSNPAGLNSWTSHQIFKKGGLTGPQFLEGGC